MTNFREKARRFLGRRVSVFTTAQPIEDARSVSFEGILSIVGKDVIVIISEQRPIAVRISEIISFRPLNNSSRIARQKKFKKTEVNWAVNEWRKCS
jgi:hypothetical protein